jgi:DNA primase
MPGLPKGQLLYNLDRASRQPFIVLVEGVTDVWRLGSMAVSGFGKDLSDQQVCLLREASQAGARHVVILLDGGETVAAWKAKRALNRAQVPTVTVDLPSGLDPADHHQDALLQEVYHQATAQGVELPPLGDGQ